MGPICANGLLHAAAELHPSNVVSLADGVRGRRVVVAGALALEVLDSGPEGPAVLLKSR